MTDMEQWNKQNDAFLALIGQVAKATPKPVTKKEEE